MAHNFNGATMKKLLTFAVLLTMVFAGSLFAQDEDEKDEQPVKKSYTKTKVGGAGGITPAISMFNNDGINKMLTDAGMPKLSSNGYLVGGEGYGYVMFLHNVRMGGFGIGGTSKSNILEANNRRKDIDYKISYGGFLVDYVVPVVHHLDIAVGASIGGGSVDITMTRDDVSFKKWDDLWKEFGKNDSTKNLTRQIKGSFGAFTPHVNVEYALLTWLQLRVGVGYPIFFSPDWKLDNRDVEVLTVPANLKPDGYTINAGIMFGFFN